MELKISEARFLDLIESEKFAPVVIQCFVRHLVDGWKSVNKYETPDDRFPLQAYIKDKFLKSGLDFDVWFNNNYNSRLLFRYKGDDYWVHVVYVDLYSGLAIDSTKQ